MNTGIYIYIYTHTYGHREYGVRVNTISAGPLRSRAASAIGKGQAGDKGHIDFSIDYMKSNAPLPQVCVCMYVYVCVYIYI